MVIFESRGIFYLTIGINYEKAIIKDAMLDILSDSPGSW